MESWGDCEVGNCRECWWVGEYVQDGLVCQDMQGKLRWCDADTGDKCCCYCRLLRDSEAAMGQADTEQEFLREKEN